MTRFNTPEFLSSAVIYEVNIRQYTPEGTFAAFQEHLPRLKKMGIDILWLMPIHPIGILNRKGILGSYYSIKDYKAVNPEFGTKDDFAELVKAIHSNGMKVILDWVANHVSWDSEWAKHQPGFIRQKNGQFVSPFDWTDVLQLEHENPAQQDAMIENMVYWVKQFDIDGFRADLPHLVPLDFWLKARTFIDPLKPDLIWLGETEEKSYADVFDITFTWKWMHTTESVLRSNGNAYQLIECLQQDEIDGHRLYFTSNHDENSWNGTEYEKFGVYAQALAVFSALYPGGVPLVYSGQEIPNHVRLPFFEKSSLAWHQPILLESFYTQLFEIRHSFTSFFKREVPIDFVHKNGMVGYHLKDSTHTLTAVFNFGTSNERVEFYHAPVDQYKVLISSGDIHDAHKGLPLQPGGYWVGVK